MYVLKKVHSNTSYFLYWTFDEKSYFVMCFFSWMKQVKKELNQDIWHHTNNPIITHHHKNNRATLEKTKVFYANYCIKRSFSFNCITYVNNISWYMIYRLFSIINASYLILSVSFFLFQIEHLPKSSATMAGTTISPTRIGGQLVSRSWCDLSSESVWPSTRKKELEIPANEGVCPTNQWANEVFGNGDRLFLNL